MAKKRSQVSLKGTGRIEARGEVFYGWDTRPLVVLSIVLTGLVPLAIATGINVGFAVSQDLTWGWALLVGVGCFAAMGLLQLALLFALTRPRVRQWFIPWARRWFPPSEEVAKGSGS